MLKIEGFEPKARLAETDLIDEEDLPVYRTDDVTGKQVKIEGETKRGYNSSFSKTRVRNTLFLLAEQLLWTGVDESNPVIRLIYDEYGPALESQREVGADIDKSLLRECFAFFERIPAIAKNGKKWVTMASNKYTMEKMERGEIEPLDDQRVINLVRAGDFSYPGLVVPDPKPRKTKGKIALDGDIMEDETETTDTIEMVDPVPVEVDPPASSNKSNRRRERQHA